MLHFLQSVYRPENAHVYWSGWSWVGALVGRSIGIRLGRGVGLAWRWINWTPCWTSCWFISCTYCWFMWWNICWTIFEQEKKNFFFNIRLPTAKQLILNTYERPLNLKKFAFAMIFMFFTWFWKIWTVCTVVLIHFSCDICYNIFLWYRIILILSWFYPSFILDKFWIYPGYMLECSWIKGWITSE